MSTSSAGLPPVAPLTFRVEWEQGLVNLELIGELDITNVDRLDETIHEVATTWPSAEAIRLQVAQLRFIDMAGIRSLAAGCERLRGITPAFELLGVTAPVRRIIEAAGLQFPGWPRGPQYPSVGDVGPRTWVSYIHSN